MPHVSSVFLKFQKHFGKYGWYLTSSVTQLCGRCHFVTLNALLLDPRRHRDFTVHTLELLPVMTQKLSYFLKRFHYVPYIFHAPFSSFIKTIAYVIALLFVNMFVYSL
jgi:hypothetical protein